MRRIGSVPLELAAAARQGGLRRLSGLGQGTRRERLQRVRAWLWSATSSWRATTSPASTATRIHTTWCSMTSCPTCAPPRCSSLFDDLREQLLPLIAELSGREVDVAPLHVDYPVSGQRQLVDQVLRWMGFDDASWRLDDTVHPFEASFAVTDMRLTTRFVGELLPDGAVRGDARVRPRSLRGRDRARPAAHAARHHPLHRDPRVAEPPLGEHRRAQPGLLYRRLPRRSSSTRRERSAVSSRMLCSVP